MKLAIIDIGSNSVRLMMWADGKSLYKKVITTRLGENLALSGSISETAAHRTVSAVEEFCASAKGDGAEIYAFATAAVRSAKNGAEFCSLVKSRCGIAVEVISGQDEALLGVYGALGENDGGIVDIGGASTEVCFRKSGETVFSVSMNLGAVKLFDLCKDDGASLRETVAREISVLDGVRTTGRLYAIGGTASTLASVRLGLSEYDGAKLQGLPLEVGWVRESANRLLAMSVAERKAMAGMDPRRADVIAGAAYLLGEVLEKLRCPEAYFSDSDNLEGYLTYRGLI